MRVERPNVMRADVVDKYIKSVIELGISKGERKDWVKIIEHIYRLNLDNRILNNLRFQLNDQIEDEKGLVPPETFHKMFFTFFKGERTAYQIYEMLFPAVSVHFDL